MTFCETKTFRTKVYRIDGNVELQIIGEVVWGKPLNGKNDMEK